jgi:hypothetical protein
MAEATLSRVVFTGFAKAAGGKLAELWAPERAAREADDGDALRTASSAFAIGKRKPTTGAIYEAKAAFDGDRIVSLGVDRQYIEMLDTPAVRAAILASRGVVQREEASRAEKRARETVPGQRAISELARIVAAGRLNDQEAIILAINSAIRKEALDLWRKSAAKGGAR